MTWIRAMHVTKKLPMLIREQAWGLIEGSISLLPGSLGTWLRYLFWKRRLRFLGKNVRFGVGVRIYAPSWVSIGDQCWIDDYVILLAGPVRKDACAVYRKHNPSFCFQEGEIVIGKQVHIAPFVQVQGHGGVSIGDCLTIAAGAKIYSLSHHYRDLSGSQNPEKVWKFVGLVAGEDQALICSPVVIQNGSAVGLNSVVLPGSTIGENSWLGAMSLLRGELPPGVVASGNPAVIIKVRLE